MDTANLSASRKRLRRTWWTGVIAVLTMAGGLNVLGAHSAKAAAGPSESVQVMMPFDGKWASTASTEPQNHPRGSLDFASDIYAPGALVKANFAKPTGNLVLKLGGTPRLGGCGADGTSRMGYVVNVDAYVDGEYVGMSQYLHMTRLHPDTQLLEAGDEIPNGHPLGWTVGSQAENFAYHVCWQVSDEAWSTGSHVHWGLFNPANSGWACFVNYLPENGKQLSQADPIGVLGGSATGQSWGGAARAACSTQALDAGSVEVKVKSTPPRNVTATAGDGAATVKWDEPTNLGTAPFSRYEVHDRDAGELCETTTKTCTITGLTNGKQYTLDVIAINGAGNSDVAFTTVTPEAAVETRRPSAPQTVTATPVKDGVKVMWTPPSDLGEPTLTKYTVKNPSTGDTLCDTNSLSCTIAVDAGKNTGFNVRAHNSVGSSPKVWVQAAGGSLPSAPQNFASTPINGGVELTWDAPENLGSPALTKYIVIDPSIPSVELCRTSETTCVVNELTAGKNKGFNVVAINSIGKSAYDYVDGVPGSVASRPLNLTATATDGGAILTWEAPTDSGHPPFDTYRVINPSTSTELCLGPETTCEINGLANGRKYGFNVVAINSIGKSIHTYIAVTPEAASQEETEEEQTEEEEAEETAQATEHDIVVRAKGERGEETFSVMVGNTLVGHGSTTTEYADYSFTTNASVTGAVKVTFTNDFFDGSIDRNLWVDYVVVNGTTYQSEDPATYTEGAWTTGVGCSPGFRRNERFTCGGTFTYTVLGDAGATTSPTDPYLPEEPATNEASSKHVIKIRAKGHTGGERFAMRIGNELIGQVTVTNEWRTYRFKLDELPTGKLFVAFMNDSHVGENDFNLQIDFVKVDGQKHETEDARIFMAGPGPDHVCSSGHKKIETLYCASAFYFADL